MNKKTYLLFAILGGVVLLVGVGVKIWSDLSNENRRLLQELKQYKNFFPAADKTSTLSGRVTNVSAGEIAIELFPRTPFSEREARTIFVSEATEYILLLRKDPAKYRQELESFSKALPQAGSNLLRTPSAFEESPIQFGNIRVGDTITVEASHVRNGERFSAATVWVLPLPVAPISR